MCVSICLLLESFTVYPQVSGPQEEDTCVCVCVTLLRQLHAWASRVPYAGKALVQAQGIPKHLRSM